MAKKASPEKASHHGFNDIIGIVLMGSAILLLIALLSYDPGDISKAPPNRPMHNMIGPIGAWVAYGWLLWLGAPAYLLPFVLVFVGLGCFFENLAYLRRRWPWAVVLMFCCMGMLDLYKVHFTKLQNSLSAPVGGVLGLNLNQYLFSYFGTTGATILFLMLYFISFIYLTNFRLGDWVRGIWAKRTESAAAAAAATAAMTDEEKMLEKRARELEKQARKLQEQVEEQPGESRHGDRPAQSR